MTTTTEIGFLSFPDIEGLHNVVKAVQSYPHLAPGPVKYRGKVKLHGTNAGVRITEDDIAAQSRTQIITPTDDNAGFAKWVETRKEFFDNIGNPWADRIKVYERDPDSIASVVAKRGVVPIKNYTVFGEWCGPGIMKGTAINQIPKKVFAIFAVMHWEGDNATMITSPEDIAGLFPALPEDVYILPWQGEEFTIDYTDREALLKRAEAINQIIVDIEPADPWVKATFGVDGICEGIVYAPGAGDKVTRKYYSDLAFKAKGEKHKVNKTKEAVQIDPEVLKSINDFTAMFATEARFEQAVSVVGSDMKNIGQFLKWVGQDVLKESKAELAESGLDWEQVNKSVQTVARNWFLAKNRAI
jgi:hypothetical protein